MFESAWVSIRYSTRGDAAWLAGLVDGLAVREERVGRPGAPSTVGVPWEGDLNDDCWIGAGDWRAHAEHIDGPRHGGAWYCSVNRAGERLFHTADWGVQPRNGAAARWLCELIIKSNSPSNTL